MTDIRLVEIFQRVPVIVEFDWLLTPLGTIDQTQELASAVLVALATDALALQDDPLPDIDNDDRRGWWGDLDAQEIWDGWPIGSRIWLLMRGKITDVGSRFGPTVARAENYTREALQPFIDRRIATAIDVRAERGIRNDSGIIVNYSGITVAVTIYRGPLPSISLQFDTMWEEVR